MAITTTAIKIQYTPTVPTNSFSFPIRYFDSTDINVEVMDALGATKFLVLDAVTDGFSVTSVNGQPEKGAIVDTTETYTTGEVVTVFREVPATQLAEFQRGGDLPPEVLNDSLDRGVAISQELIDESIRHLTCPITDPDGLVYELPTVELRKDRAVGFDSDGNAIAIDLASTGTLAVDATKGLDLTSNIISGKVDAVTMDFDGSGNFRVKDDAITNEKIDDGAVESNSIATHAVIFSKIEPLATMTVIGNTQPSEFNAHEIAVKDEDTMASDSALAIATQQSIKAYVDKQVARMGNVVQNIVYDYLSIDEVGDYTDLKLDITETSISLVDAGDRVKIDATAMADTDPDFIWFLWRKIGSGAWTTIKAPQVGTLRNSGLVAPYDTNIDSTPVSVSWSYIDSPNTLEPVSYAIGHSGKNNRLALNGSWNDTDHSDNERGMTSLILSEIPTP